MVFRKGLTIQWRSAMGEIRSVGIVARLLFGTIAVLIVSTGTVSPAFGQLTAWTELPNTALSAALPSPLPMLGYGSPGGIVGAWNQPAVDTKRGRWIFAAAGGHADYSGNEVYSFKFPTGPWVRLRNPSAAADMVPFRSKDAAGKVNQVTWCAENNHPCNANRDGTPVSVHTYGGIAYLPDQDVLYVFGGSRWWDGKGHKWGWWLTNLDTSPPQWQRKLDGPTGYLGVSSVWDPVEHRLHVRENTAIYSYDPAKDATSGDPLSPTTGVWAAGQTAWKRRSLGDSGLGDGMTAVLDPGRRLLIRIGHRFRYATAAERAQGLAQRVPAELPHVQVYDLTKPDMQIINGVWSGSNEVRQATTGAVEMEMDEYPGCSWDAAIAKIVCLGMRKDARYNILGLSLFVLDPATWVWTRYDPPAGSTEPVLPGWSFVGNRFTLWNGYGYYVAETAQNVWRIRLPWTTGSLPPPPPPTLSYTLTITRQGTGSGTTTGAGTYAAGTTVIPTAMPGTGSTFNGFSAPCNAPVVMNANVSCVATFTATAPPPPPTDGLVKLTIKVFGPGTVTPNAAQVTTGTKVTLTAKPNTGAVFSHWEGKEPCPTGRVNPTTITVKASKTCWAVFTGHTSPPPPPPPASVMLTIVVSGPGSVSPHSATVSSGTPITVTASPNKGATFVGWQGGSPCPSGTATRVTITLTSSKSCGATFTSETTPPPPPPPPPPGGYPTRVWIGEPFPDPYPAGGKHGRFLYDTVRQQLVITGGDRGIHSKTMPGYGSGFDGNGNGDVWARSATGWTRLAPLCMPPGQVQPARPDNVIWVYDSLRDRGIIARGFYFGITKALDECLDPDPLPLMDILAFDFASGTWQRVPYGPPPKGWGGDDHATFGVYDPVSDQMIRWRFAGSGWLEVLNLATGTWTEVQLGSNYPVQTPQRQSLAAGYAWRSQTAIDVQGRAVYWVAGFHTPRLQRWLIDVPGHTGEDVVTLPPDFKGPIASEHETYMVFDPVNRVLLIPSVPWLVGEVTGLAIYHVDTGQMEWEPIPLPPAVPDRIRGNVWGFDELTGCMIGEGGLGGAFSKIDGAALKAPTHSWRYCYGQ